MYTIKNFIENDDIKTLDNRGPFSVIEYRRDLSVMPDDAKPARLSSAVTGPPAEFRRKQDGLGALQAGPQPIP